MSLVFAICSDKELHRTVIECQTNLFSPACDPCSFKKTWGCGAVKTEKEIAAYNVIREQHRLLGPMSFGETSVLGLFILLVALWFSRDPRFVDGWATHVFNSKAEFVYRITKLYLYA